MQTFENTRPESPVIPIPPPPSPNPTQKPLLYLASRTHFPILTVSKAVQAQEETSSLSSTSSPSSSEKNSVTPSIQTTISHDKPPSIFPPFKRLPHYPSYEKPSFVFLYHPPTWFPDAEFRARWYSPAVDITNHLLPQDMQGPESVIRFEHEFDGIPIRLVLDPEKSTHFEPFERGTVINFMTSNSDAAKYIVECCQHTREQVAYLKVLYRTISQEVFAAFDPDHPALILVIPQHLNAAPSPQFEERIVKEVQMSYQVPPNNKPAPRFWIHKMCSGIISFFRSYF